MGDEQEEQKQQQQPQWAVKVEEGHNPDEVAEQHGFINLGPVANLKNYFLFEARHQNKRSTQHAATVSPTCVLRGVDLEACVQRVCDCNLLCCCVDSLWPITPEYHGWRSRR
jgi:hypothetical protein